MGDGAVFMIYPGRLNRALSGVPDSWSAIEYMTIDDIYDQVTQAGPGCRRDTKDAFRMVSVAEDNQHLLAFQ